MSGSRGSEDTALVRLRDLRAHVRCDNARHAVEVSLSGNALVADPDLEWLTECRHVRSLYLDDTAIGNEGLQSVGLLHRLEVLFLTDCKNVTDKGIERLSSLQALRELDLSGTMITDDALVHVAAFPNIESLYLKRTRIGDKGVQSLRNLASLKELSLIRTSVTDASIAALQCLTKLERLELVSTGITDAAIRDLCALSSLTHLYIHVTGITNDGAQLIAKALPHTEIWHPSL